jgi:hypothetical protein
MIVCQRSTMAARFGSWPLSVQRLKMGRLVRWAETRYALSADPSRFEDLFLGTLNGRPG